MNVRVLISGVLNAKFVAFSTQKQKTHLYQMCQISKNLALSCNDVLNMRVQINVYLFFILSLSLSLLLKLHC